MGKGWSYGWGRSVLVISEEQFVEMTFFIMPGLSDGFEDSCFGQGGKICEVSVFQAA